jgi:hypothetical protein
MEPLTPSPVPSIFSQPALDLTLKGFHSLEVKGVSVLVDWVAENAAHLTPETLKEPTIKVPLFESYVISTLGLAAAAKDIKLFAPDWDSNELEESASLLVAAFLIRRESSQKAAQTSSSPEGEEAATRRGWKVVEDAISDLKEDEDELVALGAAILSGKPEKLAAFVEDTDDGSFADAAGDVQRRLDFIKHEDHKALFANTAITEEFLTKRQQLFNDAWAFFLGREGRQVPKTKLTLARDQAFSLLLERLIRLQHILKAVYYRNAEAREKLEGSYWKRLERLGKARRKRTPQEAGKA